MKTESQRTRDQSSIETLSNREREVLRLVSDGWTNSEIGERLGLSVHAVKFHLASVYRKLNVSNRTVAAVALLTAETTLSPSPDEKLV